MKTFFQKFDETIPIGFISLLGISLATVNEILQAVSVILGLAYLVRKWYREEQEGKVK